MPNLVGETQSAFVARRQILNGALIANEAVWWQSKGVLLKLDFQKAYNTIKWGFLEDVLANMDFGEKWRRWVNYCISTTSMSILINDFPVAPFKMRKGLRLGDPLSPFLFVLAANVFNKMVGRVKEFGLVEGICIGNDRVELSHLQFADNTLVFCLANKEILLNFRRLMRCFAVLFGLNINYNKLTLIPFGCEETWKEEMLKELKWPVVKLAIMYLVVPLGANP